VSGSLATAVGWLVTLHSGLALRGRGAALVGARTNTTRLALQAAVTGVVLRLDSAPPLVPLARRHSGVLRQGLAVSLPLECCQEV
jgi:hypothetical protein